MPRTFIKQTEKALKGYTKSYEIELRDEVDPLQQLNITRRMLEYEFKKQLEQLKGYKFVLTLRVTFEKSVEREITKTAYFNSQPKIVLNQEEVDLSEANQEILNKIAVWISEGSGWVIFFLVDAEYVNIGKYDPLKGSSYIQLPLFLNNSSKGLINLQNEDDKCFMWCHIRHLNPKAKNPQRIKETDKNFISNLNYKDIEFPVTLKQYNKIEKQNSITVNVFSFEKQDIFPIYVTKENYDNTMNLLLITKEDKLHYVLIYKNILFNNKQIYRQMKTIRSVNHQLGSYDLNKISLNCFDDKRYILHNGQSSFAYGNKKIKHI